MTTRTAATDEMPAAQATDAAGEMFIVPSGLRFVWIGLIALVLLEAAHEVAGLPGSSSLYEVWIHCSVIVLAGLLCFARAAYEPHGRGAWCAFGAGMICWSAGTALWDLLYEGNLNPPYPSVADALWLSWYPLTALGIALLIHARVGQFELHRWMDGFAVMLLVLVASFPLVLEPVHHYAHEHQLAAIVDVSYPVLDTLLLGAILGVFGLLAWRPDKVWLALGVGCLVMACADAAFAVQQAHGVGDDNRYDFVWAAGGALIAYAAWVSAPHRHEHIDAYGWRAIALPLAAQLLAVALQVCLVLIPAWDNETHRVVVLIVLVIATVQLILARPRMARSP